MKSKRFACALAAGALLIAAPCLAQAEPSWHGGHSAPHGGPGPHSGPGHAPHFAFAHHDFAHFSGDEHARWVGGRWNHGWHHGHFGWWWFAGGAWYFYDAPIYPYPGYVSDEYVDADDAGGPGQYWYYCQSPPGYYPYIRRCMVPWQPVPAGAPQQVYGPGPGYGPAPGANGGPSDGPAPRYQEEGPGPNDQPPPGYREGPGPNDQPPPGYREGPGPNDQPPPGDEDGPPGDQPPQGYQGPDQGPGPGNQGSPGYPQGYQSQPPRGSQPPPTPGDHPPPGN